MTDQQVIFQCQSMHCLEAVNFSLDLLHTKSKESMFARVPKLGPIIRPRYSYPTLRHYLTEYTTKSLTFQSDALNAISGILRSGLANSYDVQTVFYGVAVGLRLPTAFTIDIFWYHKKSCSRRAGFPSWSWAGWIGPVGWRTNILEITYQGYGGQKPCSPGVRQGQEPFISFETEDGKFTSGLAYFRRGMLSPSDSTLKPFLRITCWAVLVQFRNINWTEIGEVKRNRKKVLFHASGEPELYDGLYAELPLRPGLTAYSRLFLDDNSLAKSRQLKLFVLLFYNAWRKKFKGHYSEGHGLVVKRTSEGVLERVGMLFLDHPCKNYAPSPSPIVYEEGQGNFVTMVDIDFNIQPLWLQGGKEVTVKLG
jgi:hypothetical protein